MLHPRRADLPRPTLFLDVGGVINDKDRLIAQWQRLVGHYFALLLGGSAAAWTSAHRVVTDHLLALQSADAQEATDFVSFHRAYQLSWVRGMCEGLNIPIPPEEECLRLAYLAIGWITRRVQAALPGAVEAIHTLRRQGYILHTASGAFSLEVDGYLKGLNIRHCFGRPYGSDLINTFKEGPEYFARTFADANVPAALALVVDDSPQAINWAAQVGARTILVSASPNPESAAAHHIESLAELPALLQQG